jgi:hypothetical protein
MDRVKPIERKRHRVGLMEFEWVALLWSNIHANHVEPGTMVAHGRTTGTAEEIQ